MFAATDDKEHPVYSIGSMATATFLMTLCVGIGSHLPANDDWPSLLGQDRNGKSAERGIRLDWTEGKLPIVWDVSLGTGYGMGSVADGRLVIADWQDRTTSRIRCLSAATGEELWQFRFQAEYTDLYGYDAGPRSSPVIDQDRVYMLGVAGHLHCLSLKSGDLIWKLDTAKQFGVVQNFFGVGSTPIIYQDKLLLMIGGSPPESSDVAPGRLDQVRPNGTAIVAVDKLLGTIKYQLGDDLASYSSIQLAEVHERLIGLAWCRNQLIGFGPGNGELLFQFPFRARKFESVNAMTPIVQGNRVFLSESYGPGSVLLELDAQFQPKIVWQDPSLRRASMATHWNTPVLHDGHLFASSGQRTNEATLRCVEFATGQVKWSQLGFGRASMTYIDQHLVVLDERGNLFLIRATPEKYDLVTKWSPDPGDSVKSLKYPCWAAPMISHGRLFVRSGDRLVCFSLIPKTPNNR